MNYLSHYYLDNEKITPAFLLGVIMPDLLKDFNRHYKKAIINCDISSAFGKQVKLGVIRHIETDALFHNSRFFHENTTYIRGQMDEANISSISYRRYFLAHLILEMELDRLLIKQFSEIAVKFYQLLDEVPEHEVQIFMQQAELADRMKEFFYIFNRFRSYRFLQEYGKKEGLVTALLRVYSRISPAEVSSYDFNKLTELIAALDHYLHTSYLSVFEDIKTQISR